MQTTQDIKELMEKKKGLARKLAQNTGRVTGMHNTASGQTGQVNASVSGVNGANAISRKAAQSQQSTASELEGEDLINSQYDEQLAASKAQLEAQLTQAQAGYKAQLGNANVAYDKMRDKAGVDSAMAERVRRESMANMGLSGAGGMSQTLVQRGRNAYLSEVGSADRQEQDYRDNINMALSNLQTQYGADMTSWRRRVMPRAMPNFRSTGNGRITMICSNSSLN